MLASVIIIIIVATITYYQVFKQGIFSAMIMAVLSVVSALVALNYYEALAKVLQGLGLGEWAPQTVSLMAIFVVLLLIFRVLTDRYIRGNMHFPMIIDRVGSAFFGLVSGLVTAGMIAIGFQLLPITPDILGFDRYAEAGKYTPEDESELFPNADGLVLSLMEGASSYCFAGEQSFDQIHPNLQTEAYMNRLVLEGTSRREAAADAVTVNQAFVLGEVADLGSGQTLSPGRGEAFLGVNFSIAGGAGTRENPGARDGDGKIRFALGNIRLAGYEPERQTRAGIGRYPIGFLLPGGKMVRSMPLSEGKTLEGSNPSVTLLFSWPEPLKTTPPIFLEFKGTARAEMPAAAVIQSTDAATAGIDAGGATQGKLTVLSGKSPLGCEEMVLSQGGDLPLIISDAMLNHPEAKVSGDLPRAGTGGIATGHVLVQFTKRQNLTNDPASVSVPDGFALVMVSAKGNALSGANLIPPVLVDTQNREYIYCGFVLVGSISSQDALEFAYSMYDDRGQVLRPDQPRTTPFPKEIAFKGQNASITRAVFLYLVAKQNQPIGIVGCRSRFNRNEQGTFWGFVNTERVVIPAR